MEGARKGNLTSAAQTPAAGDGTVRRDRDSEGSAQGCLERGTVGEVEGEYCGIRQVKSLLFPVKLAHTSSWVAERPRCKVD